MAWKRMTVRSRATLVRCISLPRAGATDALRGGWCPRPLYRLMDNSKVTHERVIGPRRRAVLGSMARCRTALILHDDTDLDTATASWPNDSTPIGSGSRRG